MNFKKFFQRPTRVVTTATNQKTLLGIIQDDIVDVSIPLSAIFPKVGILAHRLKNEEFSQWLKYERGGYPNLNAEELAKILPDYRLIDVRPIGDIINGFTRFTDVPIPLHTMPDWFQEMVTQVHLIHGVKAIESTANKQEAGYFGWSHNQIGGWNEIMHAQGETANLISARAVVPAAYFNQVLDTARSRLQEFVLELYDNEWVVENPRQEAQVVRKLVQNYIFQKEVSMSTFDQRGQQVSAQNNAAGDVNISGGVNILTQANINFTELAAQLSTLLNEMKIEATKSEHFVSMGEVAKAEQAAKEENSEGVFNHLKLAGKWALDVATKIGVNVATEAIEQATGIKPN